MSHQKYTQKIPRKKLAFGLLVSVGMTALLISGASAMKHGKGFGHGGYGGGMHHGKSKRMAEKFKAADTDNDGFISKSEFDTHRSANFTKKDSNADGFITADDLDGAVKAKVAERAERMMKKFDKNGDGQVTKDELVAMLSEKMTPHIKRRMGRRLKRMDKNWDGKVSKPEFDGITERRFARKDKDSDGKLSLDEMRSGGKHHGRGEGGMDVGMATGRACNFLSGI